VDKGLERGGGGCCCGGICRVEVVFLAVAEKELDKNSRWGSGTGGSCIFGSEGSEVVSVIIASRSSLYICLIVFDAMIMYADMVDAWPDTVMCTSRNNIRGD
jgi:hypothetical protein